MTRVVVKGLEPGRVRVADVITRDVVVARADDSLQESLQRMQAAKIRHLPVVEGDQLIGFLSFRDLLQMEVSEKVEEIEFLNSYIHFQPPEGR
jgi:predicted transcriptional regulator